MKLDVGCGKCCKEDYKGVDVDPDVGAFYCCQAWDLPLDAGSVDEIYARHFVEHLTPSTARKTLKEWKRVLKKTGAIHLIFPNLEYHCRQISLPGRSEYVAASNFDHAMAGLYGWISSQGPNPFMEHKWGYTKSSFGEFAKEMGFRVKFIACRECDIEAILHMAT